MRKKTAPVTKQLFDPFIAAIPLRHRWWEPWAHQCAGAYCPHRGKLFPAWLRSSARVLFEGRWYCESRCFKSALEFRVAHLLSSSRARKTKAHRLPIGLLLIGRGLITSEQLRHALRLQRENGTGRLGEWFCLMAVVQEEHIAAALAQQWGCPVFPLDTEMVSPSWSGRIPFPLLYSAHAALAHASLDGRILHLAFGERVDHFLLYAVERMLDCRTVACIAPESRIAQSLANLRLHNGKTDLSFDTIRDPIEMSWIICNYAGELQATRVAVARVSAHIWVRFFSGSVARDLLFRVLPDTHSSFHLEPFAEMAKAFLPQADSNDDGVSDASGLV
jgi:hypothetical protein